MTQHLDIFQLSPAERILLAEELWDSLVDTPELAPIPAEHLEELKHRLDAEAAGGVTALSLADFRRKLLSTK